MPTTSIVKLVVISALVAIVLSLFAALRALMMGRGNSSRTARALTWRIVLSLILFGLLVLGMWSGTVVPHGPGG